MAKEPNFFLRTPLLSKGLILLSTLLINSHLNANTEAPSITALNDSKLNVDKLTNPELNPTPQTQINDSKLNDSKSRTNSAPSKPSSKTLLLNEWKKIDRKIKKTMLKETELSHQKINLELALMETNENIKTLSQFINEKRELVLHRIRYLNQDSGSDLLRHLLESRNPGELDRQLKFFLSATQYDMNLVQQYTQDLHKLEKEKAQQALRVSQLSELQNNLKKQMESYKEELAKKSEVLNKIKKRLKTKEKLWTQELQNAVATHDSDKTNLYQSLLNKNLLDRKGQLTSPTEAALKYKFGIVKFNVHSPPLPFHGVLFESSVGAPVRAIADGTIAWMGHIEGLGDTLILDHGRDLHSIYSRVQLANKHIGEMIEEGSIFSKVISASSRLGPGLYFEVREQGRPSDPLRWILTKHEWEIIK